MALRDNLQHLDREELESYLLESLWLLTKMTHQLSQLRDYIEG